MKTTTEQQDGSPGEPDEVLFETVARRLEEAGYAVLPGALPASLTALLTGYLAALRDDEFHQARIGRHGGQQRDPAVRRDRIHWIQASAGGATWLAWLHQFRCYLNRRLFLGLQGVESHFSVYRPGDFYRPHVDSFKGNSNRFLSLVTYLNRDWQPDWGGELVIYSPEQEPYVELFRVLPEFGTLAVFLSEEFPHEVLPASQDRCSVAAWFSLENAENDLLNGPP